MPVLLLQRSWNADIGCVVLHVDDLLVARNRSHKEFQEAIRVLRKTFHFGKWEELSKDHDSVYCGGKIKETENGLSLDYHDYMRKVHPVTIPKGKDLAKKLSAAEVSRARRLLGALQWPAVQGVPALAATSSILAAEINNGSGQLLADLNKALRFGKQASEVKLQMTKVANSLDDLCFIAFSDAAFGVRSDGSSQGGFFVLLTNKVALEGKQVYYNVLSWRSFKSSRECAAVPWWPKHSP